MTDLLDKLSQVSPAVVYAVVGALVFAEDALFVGFVLPGEAITVLGGVIASQGHVSLAVLLPVVVVAAIAGDSVGYEVGRWAGPRILDIKVLAPHRDKLDDAQDFLRRRGGWAVFLGRFVAFFRAVMPALAGIARMRYPKFLTFNALGGLVWGTAYVLLGYFGAGSYQRIESAAGRAVLLVVVLVVAGVLIGRKLRARRKTPAGGAAGTGGTAAEEPPRPLEEDRL